MSGFYRRDGDPTLFPPATGQGVQTYILDNGFHTDLVLPRAALQQGRLAQAAAHLGPGDWVYVGWGDARFYVEEGPIGARWKDGLRALFGRDNASVVRLYSGGDPSQGFSVERVQGLRLSPAGVEALVEHIGASFEADPAGGPVLMLRRTSDGAYFWHSRERFWLGRLCNHWTLQALEAAGLRVWPWRPMTSGEVMRTARRAEAKAAKLDLRSEAH